MIDDGKEHYELVMGKSNIIITLGAPLDRPMEKIQTGITGPELMEKLNELITRHNALLEVVTRLATKG